MRLSKNVSDMQKLSNISRPLTIFMHFPLHLYNKIAPIGPSYKVVYALYLSTRTVRQHQHSFRDTKFEATVCALFCFTSFD